MYKQKVGSPVNILLFCIYLFAIGLMVFGGVECLFRELQYDQEYRLVGFALMVPVFIVLWRYSMTTAEYRFLGQELVIWCVTQNHANRLSIRLDELYAIDGYLLKGEKPYATWYYDCCATLQGRFFRKMKLVAKMDNGVMVMVVIEPDETLRNLIKQSVFFPA